MRYIVISLFLLSLITSCTQPEAPITKADYDRAVSFLFENINHKEVLNLHIDPYWFRENDGFWYPQYEADAKVFKQFLFAEGEPKDLFDHELIADQLSEILDRNIDPYDLPFDQLIQRVDKNFRVNIEGKSYLIDLENDEVKTDPESELANNAFERVSPDGKWVAFTRDYNPVSYTHLRAHETKANIVCRLLLE